MVAADGATHRAATSVTGRGTETGIEIGIGTGIATVTSEMARIIVVTWIVTGAGEIETLTRGMREVEGAIGGLGPRLGSHGTFGMPVTPACGMAIS